MGKRKRYILLLFIFGLILDMDPILLADVETGGDNSVTESEVVIHSPTVNQFLSDIVKGEKESDAKVKDGSETSPLQEKADVTAEDIIRLTEDLKNEQKYLEQLDLKYKSLNENTMDNINDTGALTAQTGDKNIETESDKEAQLDASRILEGSQSGDKTQIIAGKGTESAPQDEETRKGSSLAADADIGNSSSPFEMAEILYEMGKYEEAATSYKSIHKDTVNERDFIWSQFQIGNCYRNQKKLDEAIKEYQAFINNYPDSFWAEQASWFIKDAKWWAEWIKRIRSDETAISDETTVSDESTPAEQE